MVAIHEIFNESKSKDLILEDLLPKIDEGDVDFVKVKDVIESVYRL